MTQPKVNVIIRTFNEENWIKHSILKVLSQNYKEVFITIVDSGSTDATIKIVEKYINKFQHKIFLERIDFFKPGLSINIGAGAIDSDYIVCISAHCIPTDNKWLSNYIDYMQENQEIVGAYGKQIPLSCTHADDARDLMITFGNDKRVFEKDYFFHNANSIIRTNFWKEYNFDVDLDHVEDRAWAKKIVNLGYKIAYFPDASVYHFHGIHQHGKNKSFRAINVLNVMNSIDDNDGYESALSLLGDNIEVCLVVIIPAIYDGRSFLYEKINQLINEYARDIKIFVVSNLEDFSDIDFSNVSLIKRKDVDPSGEISFRTLMRNILYSIEEKLNTVIDGLIFYDLSYSLIDPIMGRRCLQIMFDKWTTSALPAWKDFGNYLIENNNSFEKIHNSYELRNNKRALYRSILGQGGAIRASMIRSNNNDIDIGELVWTEDVSILLKESKNA